MRIHDQYGVYVHKKTKELAYFFFDEEMDWPRFHGEKTRGISPCQWQNWEFLGDIDPKPESEPVEDYLVRIKASPPATAKLALHSMPFARKRGRPRRA